MSVTTPHIEIFRRKLEQALDILCSQEKSQLQVAVIRGLLIDFDALFPRKIYQISKINEYKKYIAQYCESDPDKCPICSSDLVTKMARKTKEKFFGCSRYPECKGTRNMDRSISLTSSIRAHIAEQMYHEARKRETNSLQRFSEIEYK